MDQPVLQLDVQVPPGVGPRCGLQPGAAGRHHGRVPAGRRRRLVELDPVEALDPRVGEGEEALAVVGVPPGAMGSRQPVVRQRRRPAYGGERPAERRGLRVRVRDMHVQAPCSAPRPLPPRGHVLSARQQGLYGGGDAVVLGDLGGRVALVAVREGLEIGARADRVRRVEDPAEVALALAGGHLDGEDRAGVVHQGAERERALVGGERAGQLGVAQPEPPVQARDRAHRLQREPADGQAGEAEEGAELGTVVLHLRVLDVEAHRLGLRARFGVDTGAEEAVAEVRALVPGLRHPLPDQIGVVENGAPGVGVGGVGVIGRPGLGGHASGEQGAADGGSGGEDGTSGRAGHAGASRRLERLHFRRFIGAIPRCNVEK